MTTQQQANDVTLERVDGADLPAFRLALQDAFGAGIEDAFGSRPGEPVPSDEDIDASVHAPGAVAYHVVAAGARAGGAVVVIDDRTHRNALAFFFVAPGMHGRGIGYRAWLAIEQAHPETAIWETHTPYFDKRNIHFYVNKCGFRIVEFFNLRHPDSHAPAVTGLPDEDDDDMFRFEKIVVRT